MAKMTNPIRWARAARSSPLSTLLCLTLSAGSVFGQGSPGPGTTGQSGTATAVEIPKGATALEGVPKVRIDSSETRTTRTLLKQADASEHRLQIQVRDGRLFWASQGNVPLTLDESGGFTYLTSGPGRYIRLTRVKDRISYVEHLDMEPSHVTYWGELRIVLGR